MSKTPKNFNLETVNNFTAVVKRIILSVFLIVSFWGFGFQNAKASWEEVPGQTTYKMWSSDSGIRAWKTSASACDTPQCLVDGAQDGDTLVDPLDYPDEAFTGYTAQAYCKALGGGGRLPTISELNNMPSTALGGVLDFFWVNSEKSTANAYYVFKASGEWYNFLGDTIKTDSSSINVWCVSSDPDGTITFTSPTTNQIFTDVEVFFTGTYYDSTGKYNQMQLYFFNLTDNTSESQIYNFYLNNTSNCIA